MLFSTLIISNRKIQTEKYSIKNKLNRHIKISRDNIEDRLDCLDRSNKIEKFT